MVIAGYPRTERTDAELWGQPPRPLALGPVIDVDTTGPVDIARLAADLGQVLACPEVD